MSQNNHNQKRDLGVLGFLHPESALALHCGGETGGPPNPPSPCPVASEGPYSGYAAYGWDV